MTADLERNAFWAEVVESLDRAHAHVAAPLALPTDGAWTVPCVAERCSPAGQLAGSELAVDVCDRQMTLWSLRLDTVAPVAVEVEARWPGGSVSSRARPGDRVDRRLVVRPGVIEQVCASPLGLVLRLRYAVAPERPWVGIDLTVDPGGATDDEQVRVLARCWWAADGDPELDAETVWVMPHRWPALTGWAHRSNSRLPDPERPSLPRGELGLVARGSGKAEVLGAYGAPEELRIGSTHVQRLAGVAWPGWRGVGTHRIAIGVSDAGDRWHADVVEPGASDAAGHWTALSSRLELDVPDEDVRRLAPFAVHNSLFSRSTDGRGRQISVHGRPGAGFGDVAHLHQSYQMHLPALAVGETGRVADELVAFAALQSASGSIVHAPRPGDGYHGYVGGYTDAHLLLGLHRYASWTGNLALLSVEVAGEVDGRRLTLLDRAVACADHLLTARHAGLCRPCGWVDAWPPGVVAQAQISIAVASALEAFVDLLHALDDDRAAGYAAEAAALRERIRRMFYDERSGLMAEHLFEDGSTRGGTADDFWAHTQIWAAAAGLVTDPRGLDLIAATRLDRGVRVLTAAAVDAEYLSAITDTDRDLDRASTATWMLASWPEMTHHYALARLVMGQPDHALDALRSQLPAGLHRANHRVLPWVYAEKYLCPGDIPWLTTWGGDPTLIELVLTGFLGISPSWGAIQVLPQLPSAWRRLPARARVRWRGVALDVFLDPDRPSGETLLDEEVIGADGTVGWDVLRSRSPRIRVGIG